MKNKKCSLKKHSEIDSINFCQECQIYLCNKCYNHHKEIFEEHHHLYSLDKNIDDIFTGFCKEKNHNKFELNLFCKTHNKLCCVSCASKYEIQGNGQHKNCDIYILESIKEEKRNNLKENIKNLEELLKGLEESIKELKLLFEKINENKEEIKIKIQGIFTKIRNALNAREEELLIEVDKQYNDIYFNEEIIKEAEQLPNKAKISLEKGKIIDKEWNNNKLNSLINDCINIDNNINEITMIKEKLKQCNSNQNILINFNLDKNDKINSFLKMIKEFNFINLNIDSNIIKSIEEIIFIKNRIQNSQKFKNKNIYFNLLFQATKDGQNSSNFHKKCDGIQDLLIFIKTTKGEIFGGYTNEGFKSRENSIVDNEAFAFSIPKKKIYNIIKGKTAICDYIKKGPCFYSNGWYLININEKMLESRSNTCTVSQSHYEGITIDYEINNGEINFYAQEIEIFHISTN